MALPVLNFSGYSTSSMKPIDLMKALQGGMQTAAMPKQLDSQQTAMDLSNALQKNQLQYAPQMSQADLAYRQAQTPALQAQTGLTSQQSQYYAPNIISEMMARMSQSRLQDEQTKYYGDKTNSEIAQNNADAGFKTEQTRFLPLQNAMEAQRTLNTGTRFGQAYQLSTMLKNMGAPAREAWIAQNPQPYSEMLNTLGNTSLANQNNQGNDMVSKMMSQLFSGQQLTINPQQQQELAKSTNASQLGITVPNNQPAVGQMSTFQTNPEQVKQLQSVLESSVNKGLVTAATRRQMEGAQQVEQIMNSPEFKEKVSSASEYAGAFGKGKAAVSALMQKNPKAYEDYISLVNQDMVLLQNRIKTLDQMGSTDSQREELHGLYQKTMDSSTSNPKQFIHQFNELGKSVERVGKAVEKSARPFRVTEGNILQGFSPITQGMKQQNQGNLGMVTVQSPSGQILNVPADKVEMLLADHPDHKRVG